MGIADGIQHAPDGPSHELEIVHGIDVLFMDDVPRLPEGGEKLLSGLRRCTRGRGWGFCRLDDEREFREKADPFPSKCGQGLPKGNAGAEKPTGQYEA